MKLEFSLKIFEKYSYFKKMCSVGAELSLAGGWTDGRTDTWRLYSRSSQFCERV